MTDIIISIILIIIVGSAVGYIIKAKKSGKKCIGCPDSGTCDKCNCRK
ncbi:MAG: FeoB-associated Cys-rich membrane protein [Clostridia bacterium]|nr:FeoB-associated Cys-rich membrane protein [Clostridia bacterium]